MFCVTDDGLKVYYEIRGNTESSETIIFLNGLTQTTLAWHLIIPPFKTHYKIFVLDFIFQGQSDKNGEWRNFDQHAKDVKAVLKQEKIEKAHMVGISYGSLVAQHFAVNHSGYLKSLVLLSTFAHKTAFYEAIELAWWRALEKGGYNLMLDIMLPTVLSENYFENPLIPIKAMKESRQDLNQSNEAIFNLMQATRQRPDYRQALLSIKIPTLIIQGEKDLLLPVHLAEEVNKNIIGSKLVVIKNAGHTLNLEHVQEVSRNIQQFLKKIE